MSEGSNEADQVAPYVGDRSSTGVPRLRVHHLMAWMAVAAVLIWLSLWFDRTARNGPPIDNRLVIGSLIIAAIAIAGALSVVGFAIGWRRRGCAFPNSPGDWLLVVVTTLSAGYCNNFGLPVRFLRDR
jgi:hypothetical protein